MVLTCEFSFPRVNDEHVLTSTDLDPHSDWEYPGIQGAGNNGVSASDSANFLLFLQVLRQTLPADAVISAATQVWPFADKSGYPMTDVSGFANVLDWVLVMNYDVWGCKWAWLRDG